MRNQIRAGRMLGAALYGAVIGLALPTGAHAQTSVLYDGSLKTTPSAQGWFYAGTGGTQTAPGDSGYTTLDTTSANSIQAGYSIIAPFALNRTTGFTVRFDVRLLTENHDSGDKNGDGLSDRAGFCVLALGDDRKGVELDFWAGEVWPQSDNPYFLHLPGPERAFLNTTAAGRGAAGLVRYDLQVQGDAFRLYVNGAAIPVLRGVVKDYTGAGIPIPYNQRNFLFLGDNTTSARASVQIARVAVSAGVTPIGLVPVTPQPIGQPVPTAPHAPSQPR